MKDRRRGASAHRRGCPDGDGARAIAVGILAPEEDLSALAPEIAPDAPRRDELRRFHTDPGATWSEQAGSCFASIRALDATGVDHIFALGVGATGWPAPSTIG